ncbi:ferredoxin [Catellatospora citrea]|uniref:ferredoxin n=1 Tax=Catellatospora citrea TaxID=53366 RepID=UPI0033D4F5BF
MAERAYWDPVPMLATAEGAPFGKNPLGTLTVLPTMREIFRGTWEMRNWRNVPGPFYGADTDTCWTGRMDAPDLVLYDDEYGTEFLFRQPTDPAEVYRLLLAATSDPFGGYAADGDEHWTTAAVREWWRNRERLLEWIQRARGTWHESPHADHRELLGGLAAFERHIEHGLEGYLRRYSFWLDHRRPRRPGETLPDL